MRKTKSKRKVAKRNTRRYKKRNMKRTSKRKPVKRRRITRRRRIQKGGDPCQDVKKEKNDLNKKIEYLQKENAKFVAKAMQAEHSERQMKAKLNIYKTKCKIVESKNQ